MMGQVLVIDRTIEDVSCIGIAGDINSLVTTFKMQRYADGVDLSEKTIQIAFKNAAGESQYDETSNVNVLDDEYFTFDWIASGEAMAVAGATRFAIEVSAENEYGEKVYVWQTRDASLTVLDSLGVIENNAEDSDHYYQILFYEDNDNSMVYALSDDGQPITIKDRVIEMPAVDKVIAVKGDANSQILTFSLPRFYKNTDLSQKVVSIKFKNAKGESDRSKCANMVADEEVLYFGWKLDGNVTPESGIVEFAIEFLGYNEKDEFYCWSTTPAQFEVYDTLNVDDDIESPGPSWIQSWWIQMDSYVQETAKNAELAKVSAEQANNVSLDIEEVQKAASTVKASEAAAINAKTAAEAAAATATNAATTASNSATAATKSEANAKSSETNAANAANIAVNAKTSAENANRQVQNNTNIASTAASNAKASETAAKTSQQSVSKDLATIQQIKSGIDNQVEVVRRLSDAVQSGKCPQIGENGNWFVWDDGEYVDTEVSASGIGSDGKSAYQQAVDGGYSGTESAFNAILAQANVFLPRVFNTTLTANGWAANDGGYRQQISVPAAALFTANDRADFDTDSAMVELLNAAVYPVNENGVLYAVTTEIPAGAVNVQVTLTRMNVIG